MELTERDCPEIGKKDSRCYREGEPTRCKEVYGEECDYFREWKAQRLVDEPVYQWM